MMPKFLFFVAFPAAVLYLSVPRQLLSELGEEGASLEDLVHTVGAFAQIHNVADTPDGQSQALVLVHRRVDAAEVVDAGPPPVLDVDHWPREVWEEDVEVSSGDTASSYEAAAAEGDDAPSSGGRRGGRRRRSKSREASRGDLVKALSNEIVAAIVKADPAASVRGRRTTMLSDSDIHATRHARAAVGGVVAAAVEARLLRERVATRSARMAVEGQRSWWSK